MIKITKVLEELSASFFRVLVTLVRKTHRGQWGETFLRNIAIIYHNSNTVSFSSRSHIDPEGRASKFLRNSGNFHHLYTMTCPEDTTMNTVMNTSGFVIRLLLLLVVLLLRRRNHSHDDDDDNNNNNNSNNKAVFILKCLTTTRSKNFKVLWSKQREVATKYYEKQNTYK